MISIKRVSKSQLAEYVDIAYRGDTDLLEKYHTQKHKSVEGAVFSTMLMIDDASKQLEMKYYKICWRSKPIGYFAVFDKFLYSYGINIKFRSPEIHESWWREVKRVLGKGFMSMIYDNNERALSFLKRNGMVELEHNLENHSILLTCQS